MTINKKFLQVIAAFQILFFHLWAPLTSTQIEQFILKTAYVGVDMFFFLSAYSLAGREIDYVPFLKDRVLKLYAKFAFFTLIMALFSKSFGVIRVVKSLTLIEFFQKGGGAFLNGRKIQVSDCDLAHSLVLFGTCPYERELAKETFELTERIFYKAIEVRRSGCAALDICYVACGRADMYYELILRPWDWAGATVILREAGGICSQADGTDVSLNGVKSYLCANPKNIREFYEIYKS